MASRPTGARPVRPDGARPTGVGARPAQVTGTPAPTRRFLRGVNREIATLIGAPVEIVDQVLRQVGTSLLDKPGDAIKAVQKGFAAVGIDASAADTFFDNIGRSFLQGTLLLFGGAVAAPTLATITKPSAVTKVVTDLTKAIVSRPGVAVAAEAGGSAGAEVAMAVTPDPFKPVAGLAGGAAGGMGAGGLGALRRGTPPGLPAKDAPSIRPQGNPEEARSLVTQRFTRRMGKLNDLIDRTIDRFARLDPDDVSEAGVREIGAAQKTARGMEGELWKGVPDRIKIDFDESGSLMADLIKNTPQAQRADIPTIARQILVKKRGRVAITKTSAKELQGLRSKLLEIARNSSSGPTPRRNKSRIAYELAEAIKNDINAANVGDDAFNAARAFSKRYNDTFTRGPIGRITRLSPEGGEATSAKIAMQRLLRDPEGPGAIRKLSEQPEFGRRGVIVEAENALRADFGQKAAAGGKAVSLSGKRREFREFEEVAKEIVEANDLIRRTLARQKDLETGAMAKFSADDPQKGAARLIGSRDPAGDARKLVSSVKGDPAALEGLRTAVIEELWRGSGGNVQGFARVIAQPKVERLLAEVLSPEDLGRLDRITQAASDISGRQQGIVRTVLTGVARAASRIGGAQVGGQLAKATGGGTVQTPGIVARASAQTFDRLFVAIPAEELLARAIVDSKWERLILRRAPKDLAEVRTLLKDMRRLLGAEAGVRAGLDEKIRDVRKNTPFDEVIQRVRSPAFR